jgi:hypothetical protein
MNARGLALTILCAIALAACGGHGSVPPSAPSQPSVRHTQVWQTGGGAVTEQFGLPANSYASSPVTGSNGVYFIDYNYGTHQLALANVGYRGAVHVFAPPAPQPSLQPQLAASTGKIYAADSANNAIDEIDEKTGAFTALSIATLTAGAVTSPSSPVYKSGVVYFYGKTTGGPVLAKLSLKYNTIKQFPAPAYGFAGTVGPDGNIYYIESAGTALLQFNVQTHAFQQFSPPSSNDCLGDNEQNDNADYYGAQPIVSFNGALYVSYENPCFASPDGGVFSVTTSGAYSDVVMDGSPGESLALGTDGNLYATTGGSLFGYASIWKIPPTRGAPVDIDNQDGNIEVAPFAVGVDGNLWFFTPEFPTSPPSPITPSVYLHVLYALSVSPQSLSLSLSGTSSSTLSVSENESGGTISAKSSNTAVATVSGSAPTFTVNAVGAGNAIVAIQDQKHNFVDVVVQVAP